mmetsp:Transcript_14024/g.30463  ORF Transcript_14024/g.30463 Transcript_14024/m.30463 type:complete len:238 (-) Transcript_14024:70-783(-)
MHDLSPYELLRLEKIRRNNARLEALGLGVTIAVAAGANKEPKKAAAPAKKRKHPRPTDRSNVPRRSSKRLKDKKGNPTADASSVAGGNDGDRADADDAPPVAIDYSYLPQEPDQLDDDEFQVYASLRAWRLERKNELEIEPYKICQNRTLCELIRRVRNDPSWGSLQCDGSDRGEEDVAAELIECWGLGPSKVAADGFGPEMMKVLGQESNVTLLNASRARHDQHEQHEDEGEEKES